MATTPKGLYYPDETTNITPLHTVLGTMQTSTDNLLTGRGSWFATTGARDSAIPTPVVGMVALVGSGIAFSEYVYNGSAWVNSWSDTGWLAVTPTSGFTSQGAMARVKGGIAYFRGALSGPFLAGGAACGTPPAVCVPATESATYKPCVNDTTPTAPFFAVISGGLIVGLAVTGAAKINLAGLSGYPVD